jgi:hypothetical protein
MAPGHGYEVLKGEVVRLRQEQKEILEALKMLFDLLEEYGPCWYTEEHHDRALFALAVSAHRSSMQAPMLKGN